ncbi:Putative SAM-dependent methyltransferase [Nitrosotalea devaniterrae]|uniref:SAM-dependent methyltransferase n=1 Tax=Nitrosotalea devaniterrae TaxID=1078905 RepID=A0A128A0N0_9ARCH|nr:Putative SAM-dependent methyltransferase [Candidatus Nitrosotalea devanaterra]
MDSSRLKKLAVKIIKKNIKWDEESSVLSRKIRWNFKYKKFFSFLYGFEISISDCKQIEEIKPADLDNKKPGTIVNINDDGTFDVKTRNGMIRITNYVIHAPYAEIKNIKDFLEKAHISDTPMLTQIPFSNNEEANRWEEKYQRFTIDNLDQLGEQLGSFKESLFENNVSNNQVTDMHELDGAEGRLVKDNTDFIEYLVAKLGLSKGDRVLDVGCGSGWACHMFSKYGFDVYGCDMSPYCISAAKNIVPTGKFFVQDVFNLPKQNNLKGKFDLIFCRGLGVAQKLVDWNDEKWMSVGTALTDMLTDKGVIYWIQLGDLSGKVTNDGLSNTTIDDLVKYFTKIGHVINVNVFGFQSFLLTKKKPNENLLHQISQFDHQVNSKIYSNWVASKDEKSSQNLSKVIYSQISQAFLLDNEKRKQGVIIIGNNALSKAYSKVCKEFQLDYKIISDDIKSYENFLECTRHLKQSIIILTEEDHAKFLPNNQDMSQLFDYVIMPFENMGKISQQSTYLISGDFDMRFKSKLSKILPTH